MVEIYRVKDKEAMDLVLQIRREVFIKEQGVPEEIEVDGMDQDAIHVLAYVDGTPAGCGRMLLQGEAAKIGRVAVRKNMRRYGIGSGMCKLLIAIAEDIGISKIYLNAQLTAVDFYLAMGFMKIGDIFMEAGIEPVKMEKSI
ncbi:MAG: GNAT family N-acetyltransferase [Bacteroidales bacterium]|nr:GNAT family N-acetyltransferase [Bacteroidales bacterium]